MELNPNQSSGKINSQELLETQLALDPNYQIIVDDPAHEENLPTIDSNDRIEKIDSLSPQVGSIGTSPTVATIVAPIVDLTQTFLLNSLAGANQTIYLDFDGNTTTGTYWNSPGTSILTPEYNTDGVAGFSDVEKQAIQNIWQRVAEDFSPFNVNVTTQAPTDVNDLIKSSLTDTRWGVRVAIGGSSADWFGSSAGGVAYVDSFNWNTDTPAFVFTQQLGNGNEKYTSEAISHEVGHTLGLNHDGRIIPIEGYYGGQGTGETGWAPLMGVGYSKNLTQWSKGEYLAANNIEDDLSIITTRNGFGYRADDTGNTIATAKALTLTGNNISGSGIIEQRTDVDYYSFVAAAGAINLNINPAAVGANLDILAELYSADGTLISSSNPIGSLAANISTTLATAGTYYLKIDGVGAGDPLLTGYSDYGSLGQYSISGNIIPSTAPVVSLALASASVTEDGTNNLVYTFSRTGDLTADLTVKYNVAGTATFGTDYSQLGGSSFTSTAGEIIFTGGSSTAILTIDPTADNIRENNETVALALAQNSNYTIATTTPIIGTILDDDIPVINLVLSSPTSVREDGTQNLVYAFSRTGDTTSTLTVNYNVGGSAVSGIDYSQIGASIFTIGTRQITFAAGASVAEVKIDPIADSIKENDETVSLTLVANSNYALGTNTTATGTILDDDTPVVTLAVSPPSVLEDGSANLIYTFSRTGSTAHQMTVKYSVGGSATLNSDYNQTGAATFSGTNGTIKFAQNSATATITINPKADTIVESNETVKLTITANSAYRVGTTATVIGTITNDDLAAPGLLPSPAMASQIIPTEADLAAINPVVSNIVQGLSIDLSQMILPTTQLVFTVDREANYNNSVGFYRTLDAQGSIQSTQGILKPTDAGYVQAALQNALANAVDSDLDLSVENNGTVNIGVSLDRSFYMPIMVADGNLAQAANGSQFDRVYTAFSSANADQTEHIRSLGDNTFGFEDMFGGGDRDYNDLIVKVSVS